MGHMGAYSRISGSTGNALREGMINSDCLLHESGVIFIHDTEMYYINNP